MFCTDDCHPDDLLSGHINVVVKRALGDGYNLWDVLLSACLNPQVHYNLKWGLLRERDPATFIMVDSLSPEMKVLAKAGCTLRAPFLTMSFMCLPVIPQVKITDKGLFISANSGK